MNKYLIFFSLILLFSCNQSKQKEDSNNLKNEINIYEEFNSIPFDNLKATEITPILEANISTEKNLIYCSSFKIAWDRLNSLSNTKIELDTNIEWVNIINNIPIDNSVDEQYITAFAGGIKDNIIEKIDTDLKHKFNLSYKPNYRLGENDVLSFAYLSKKVKFLANLERVSKKMKFNNEKVATFGVKCSKRKETNIIIHDYINSDNFIIELKTDKDKIYLAKIKPENTLEKTYETVIKRTALKKIETLNRFEKLSIPYINFDINKEYTELYDKCFIRNEKDIRFLKKANQIIKFDMNEDGIELKSMVEVVEEASAEEDGFRKYIFDKPFLIIMKEKNKNKPYLVIWINNTELMKNTYPQQ